jgi:hypothetical protein
MYDRGEIMSEEERLQILKYIYTADILFNRIPINRSEYPIKLNDPTIPAAIWKIKQRLIEKEGLTSYRQDPNFEDVISVILPGGFIHKHRDPNGGDLSVHSRFNVFIRVPDKHDTYYGGRIVESKERHYVMCRSGLDIHWSSVNKELIPRISLSFGFMLPIHKVTVLYKVPETTPTSDLFTVITGVLYDLVNTMILIDIPPSLEHNTKIWVKESFQDMMKKAILRAENLPDVYR